MITRKVPRESFLSRVEYDPLVLGNYKGIIKGTRESGVSEYKNTLLDRVDEVEARTLHNRVLALIDHPIKEELEQDKELIKKTVDQLKVYVGEESYTIVSKSKQDKFGGLIYKERYRMATKVDGIDPVLTVKKFT
jgi:hypothetical protein